MGSTVDHGCAATTDIGQDLSDARRVAYEVLATASVGTEGQFPRA